MCKLHGLFYFFMHCADARSMLKNNILQNFNKGFIITFNIFICNILNLCHNVPICTYQDRFMLNACTRILCGFIKNIDRFILHWKTLLSCATSIKFIMVQRYTRKQFTFMSLMGVMIHRYMLILTQTQKKHSCQIFTNISAGFFRTTVTVLQMD